MNQADCTQLCNQKPDEVKPLSEAQAKLLHQKLSLDGQIVRLEGDLQEARKKPGFPAMALQRMHVQVQTMYMLSNLMNQRIEYDL